MRSNLPHLIFSLTLGSLLASSGVAQTSESDTAEQVEFFEKRIRPMLSDHCYQCHSADTKPSGGLRVDDRNGLLLGGDNGAAVVPGNPGKSLLLQRVKHENPKRRMPKEGELLTDAEVTDLTAWIENGAAWPRERIPSSIGKVRTDYEDVKARHWAWRPLHRPAIPAVADAAWPLGDIDRFILAKLEARNLSAVAGADPLTLIRRITFDLTGLPPTPAEIESFASDPSPDAYARVVDRLLGSSHYGERWGRHWLDVARYGESCGPSRNIPYPHAWKYRDYVLDAVNKDVPYDRFIQEQIAGDLLPAPTPAERDRLLTATGFLALGAKDVNQRFKVRFIMDNVDERIDTVSRSILGLTVSCARCHDHKFDPIPVTDYYALAGIFTSTEDCAGVRNKMGGSGLDYYNPAALVKLSSAAPAPPAEQVEQLRAQVAAAKKAWDGIRGTPAGMAKAPNGGLVQAGYRKKFENLQGELLQLTDPAARGYVVHGVREAATIADTEVRIRGEAERIGPTIPRGFLSTFQVAGAAPINPTQSGRLELAHWLTSANNPLTPRVLANRVWQHLFGQGIVSTVDNFGTKGDQPSNPELLDYLATELIREGWSVKKLIRTIVLTRAYQLGSDAPSVQQSLDPGNRFIWRHSPRRLDAEEIRDTMLASAGRLQTMPPESAAKELKMIEMRDNGPEAKKIHNASDRSLCRSVYLPLLRGVTPKSLEAFDPVVQSLVTGQRDATTVPTQALYLLNGGFVREQALAFAERVVARNDRFDSERIRDVYLLTLGRVPAQSEVSRAENFLADYSAAWKLSNRGEPLIASTGTDSAEENSNEQTAAAVPVNPDDIDRDEQTPKDELVQPRTAKSAAWMSLIQALYASAEFRFVR